jgi:GMP synthase (glutamine-hydrolysing)
MKPLAVIRNEAMCPLGIVEPVLDAAGVSWRYVEAWRGEPLPDLAQISGLVVLGGVMNVDEVEQYPYLRDVRSLVRAAADAERPVLGVCLGAQVLARAFDAPVHRAQVREVGFCKVEATATGAADPVTAPFAPASLVFQFHEDHCALPAGAQLLAHGETVEAQAFRIGRAYGVQFHFEVTTEVITAWIDSKRPGELEDVWGTTRAALLAEAALHLDAQQVAGRRAAAQFVGLLDR